MQLYGLLENIKNIEVETLEYGASRDESLLSKNKSPMGQGNFMNNTNTNSPVATPAATTVMATAPIEAPSTMVSNSSAPFTPAATTFTPAPTTPTEAPTVAEVKVKAKKEYTEVPADHTSSLSQESTRNVLSTSIVSQAKMSNGAAILGFVNGKGSLSDNSFKVIGTVTGHVLMSGMIPLDKVEEVAAILNSCNANFYETVGGLNAKHEEEKAAKVAEKAAEKAAKDEEKELAKLIKEEEKAKAAAEKAAAKVLKEEEKAKAAAEKAAAKVLKEEEKAKAAAEKAAAKVLKEEEKAKAAAKVLKEEEKDAISSTPSSPTVTTVESTVAAPMIDIDKLVAE